MKPKNIKERRSSFIKFLLLFLLTTTTVVMAVFFNFSIPQKENALLKERAKNIEREMSYQREFAVEVSGVQAMIDSLDTPGQNLPFTNTLIHSRLADLQSSIPRKDSTYRYNMYAGIIETLVDLQATKNELHSLDDAKTRIAEYKEVLEQTRNELEQTKRDLDILRISRN
ncbi:type VI secretion system TssO [Tamlana sp. 2_MG-2023]|uniref:type VI secretion system TssO n=1 Tax=unclassified Tamlana TaxID=2614803 RepID=UPI0026E14972|nr:MULTISPECIES: type VI secretion system TssO [unclassified Tamlana]MDO6761537.1 type VI secretion system TssO [Tamlana sp. 2_MG-2023]MDO6792369.1 type VI secretion system TssO [Tamlana sp. 1_MG-2023]